MVVIKRTPILSIAVTCHNEGTYLRNLVERLTTFCSNFVQTELVILDDCSTDQLTIETLQTVRENSEIGRVEQKAFAGNFADHKNHLNSLCKGRWIFQLDADEMVSEDLLEWLPSLIAENEKNTDAFWLPRINIVHGITRKHVEEWNWTIGAVSDIKETKQVSQQSEEYQLLQYYNLIEHTAPHGEITYFVPLLCWPDYQCRLYRNDPSVYWTRAVHEQLVCSKYATLPQETHYAIWHEKDIIRQEKQNLLYDSLSLKRQNI